MYQVIWELKVKFTQREIFEKFYGPGGEWVKFFSKSTEYMGTDVLACGEDNGIFLVIDEWQSEESYSIFITIQKTAYLELEEKAKSVSRTKNRVWIDNKM